MSKSDAQTKTPSELLAAKVAEVLVEKAVITKTDAQKFTQSLASGKLKAEDWRVLVEKAIDKEASHG